MYTSYNRDRFKRHQIRTDSRLSPDTLFTTDSDEVLNSKQSFRWKKHKLTTKCLSCDDDENDEVTSNYSVDGAVPATSSELIMSSLSKINSQLGEVLTRLGQPTPSPIQPYPSSDPLLQPRRPDKTEEELRSKWLQYLGKEVLVYNYY